MADQPKTHRTPGRRLEDIYGIMDTFREVSMQRVRKRMTLMAPAFELMANAVECLQDSINDLADRGYDIAVTTESHTRPDYPNDSLIRKEIVIHAGTRDIRLHLTASHAYKTGQTTKGPVTSGALQATLVQKSENQAEKPAVLRKDTFDLNPASAAKTVQDFITEWLRPAAAHAGRTQPAQNHRRP